MRFGNKRRFVAVMLVGVLAMSLSFDIAEGKRKPSEADQPRNNTIRAGTDKTDTVSANGNRGTIRERVDAILHGDAAKKEDKKKSKQQVKRREVAPTVSATDKSIIGTAIATQQQCVDYLLAINPKPSISVKPEELVAYYYEEGELEGIRPDVAFVQALKETGYFRYGGTVSPDQNNYCGLGTTSATVKGAYFATAQLGVRAHIQHLLAYVSTSKPLLPIVDPRYELVRDIYGKKTLKTWEDLNGRWAVPGTTYGQSILNMYQDLLKK